MRPAIEHTHTHTLTCTHSSPWLSAILPSSLTAFFAALLWCYRWGPLLRDQSKVFDSLLGMLVHTHGVQQRAKHEKFASTKRATCTTRSQLVPRRSPEVHLRLCLLIVQAILHLLHLPPCIRSTHLRGLPCPRWSMETITLCPKQQLQCICYSKTLTLWWCGFTWLIEANCLLCYGFSCHFWIYYILSYL